jgi:hypothetical protein
MDICLGKSGIAIHRLAWLGHPRFEPSKGIESY